MAAQHETVLDLIFFVMLWVLCITIQLYVLVIGFCDAVQFSTSVRYVSLCETGLDKAQPSIRLYELSIPGLGEGIELPSTILNSLQSHT